MTEQELLEQPDSEYMSTDQRAFFRDRLQAEMATVKQRIEMLQAEVRIQEKAADDVDVALIEQNRQYQLQSLDRESSSVKEIRLALDAIDSDEYGWCSRTGEKIGIPRLLSRPRSLLCFEAQSTLEELAKHRRVA